MTPRAAVLLGTVFLVMAVWPAGGNASTSRPVAGHRFSLKAPVVPSSVRLAGNVRSTLLTGPRRSAQVDSSALRDPASAFAPATITFDAVESNSDADDKAHQQFAQFHSMGYAGLGRISGTYQIAVWNPSGGQVIVRYLSSIMSSAGAAIGAQTDSVNGHVAFGGTPQPCVNSAPPPANWPNCNYIVTQDVGKTTWFADFVWAIGTCLIETGAQFLQSLDQATQTQAIATLDNITSVAAGLANQNCTGSGGTSPTPTNTIPAPPTTATPTSTIPANPATATPTSPAPTATPTEKATATRTSPTAPDIAILDVRVEKQIRKGDLTRPPLLVVKAGQVVQLAIYADAISGTPGTPLKVTFDAKSGSTVLLQRTVNETLPPALPAELHFTDAVRPAKKGKYTFTGTVEAGANSQSKSFDFTVAGSTKHQCVTIGGTQYCNKP